MTGPRVTGTEDQERSQAHVLPDSLYPGAFWVALPVLALSLLVPAWAGLGLWFMMLLPALAALVVIVRNWRRDRRVSLAALTALLGLGLVYVVKGWLAALAGS